MSELIYIDTNIYLDYFLNRRDNLRPLGQFAYELLAKSIECKYKIVVSDIIIFELKKKIPKDKLLDLMSWLKPKTIIIKATQIDKRNAECCKIHYPDSLHIILAKKCNSTLVSNDKEMQEFGAISAQYL